MIGSANPIRNQTKKELPLIFPMAPAERPQKNIRTRKAMSSRVDRAASAGGQRRSTESAQRTAMTAPTRTTIHATAATTPMTTLKRIQAAISRTATATAFIASPESAEDALLLMASLSHDRERRLKEFATAPSTRATRPGRP